MSKEHVTAVNAAMEELLRSFAQMSADDQPDSILLERVSAVVSSFLKRPDTLLLGYTDLSQLLEQAGMGSVDARFVSRAIINSGISVAELRSATFDEMMKHFQLIKGTGVGRVNRLLEVRDRLFELLNP